MPSQEECSFPYKAISTFLHINMDVCMDVCAYVWMNIHVHVISRHSGLVSPVLYQQRMTISKFFNHSYTYFNNYNH